MTFSGRSSGSETFIHHDYVPVLQTITAFCFSAFIAFVFVLLCQNTAFARASSNGDLPTKADLQAQLDSLNKQKDLSAQDKLVQQDLTDTLATLDKIDRIKEETVQLRQKVAEAPEKMRAGDRGVNST